MKVVSFRYLVLSYILFFPFYNSVKAEAGIATLEDEDFDEEEK